ncbi:ABC transporter ATP-binding protein [Halobacteriales archaeon Cl-PHB]
MHTDSSHGRESLLDIRGLETVFETGSGTVEALRGVNLSVDPGERVGLVGESGSGKSVTARSVLQLIQSPPGKIVSGTVEFQGTNLLENTESEMRAIRGSEIAMIFQDPSSSLDPVYTIKNQMVETITHNRAVDKHTAVDIARDLLEEVDMPRPDGVLESYPHELSGGMKQRVMIAMTLAFEPDLLIADEPTTALDVTVQKKVLSVFEDVVADRDLAVLWITHNLGVVAEFCDKLAVMYAGEVVESGDIHDIFANPTHPYTRELLRTIPNIENPTDDLHVIDGTVPNMEDPPTGCAFHPRCPDAETRCTTTNPDPVSGQANHQASCLVHDTTDALDAGTDREGTQNE